MLDPWLVVLRPLVEALLRRGRDHDELGGRLDVLAVDVGLREVGEEPPPGLGIEQITGEPHRADGELAERGLLDVRDQVVAADRAARGVGMSSPTTGFAKLHCRSDAEPPRGVVGRGGMDEDPAVGEPDLTAALARRRGGLLTGGVARPDGGRVFVRIVDNRVFIIDGADDAAAIDALVKPMKLD